MLPSSRHQICSTGADARQKGAPAKIITQIRQESLAEMNGTTRSRVSFFMNKFRTLGFIDYKGGIKIHSSLLNIVLNDRAHIVRAGRHDAGEDESWTFP